MANNSTAATGTSVALGVALVGGCAPGIIANLVAGFIIVKNDFFKNHGGGSIYKLSFSLLVSDTLHLCVLAFYLAPASAVQSWLLAGWLREVPGKVTRLSWYAMEIMLCILAINRFVAVCKPQHYAIWFSNARTVAAIGITWILSAMLCVIGEVLVPCCPLYLFYGAYSYVYLDQSYNYNHNYLTRTMDIFTSVSVVVLHALVIWNIRASSSRVAESLASDTLQRRRHREIRYAIQLLVVSAIYLAVWVLFDLLNRLISPETAPVGTYIFVPFLELFNNSANGFVLLCMNKEVKQEAKKLLSCQKATSQGTGSVTVPMAASVKSIAPTVAQTAALEG